MSIAIWPIREAVRTSLMPFIRQKSFSLMIMRPMHVAVASHLSMASRPELATAHVTIGPVPGVASRNLVTMSGLSSSNIPPTPSSSTMEEGSRRTMSLTDIPFMS